MNGTAHHRAAKLTADAFADLPKPRSSASKGKARAVPIPDAPVSITPTLNPTLRKKEDERIDKWAKMLVVAERDAGGNATRWTFAPDCLRTSASGTRLTSRVRMLSFTGPFADTLRPRSASIKAYPIDGDLRHGRRCSISQPALHQRHHSTPLLRLTRRDVDPFSLLRLLARPHRRAPASRSGGGHDHLAPPSLRLFQLRTAHRLSRLPKCSSSEGGERNGMRLRSDSMCVIFPSTSEERN